MSIVLRYISYIMSFELLWAWCVEALGFGDSGVKIFTAPVRTAELSVASEPGTSLTLPLDPELEVRMKSDFIWLHELQNEELLKSSNDMVSSCHHEALKIIWKWKGNDYWIWHWWHDGIEWHRNSNPRAQLQNTFYFKKFQDPVATLPRPGHLRSCPLGALGVSWTRHCQFRVVPVISGDTGDTTALCRLCAMFLLTVLYMSTMSVNIPGTCPDITHFWANRLLWVVKVMSKCWWPE